MYSTISCPTCGYYITDYDIRICTLQRLFTYVKIMAGPAQSILLLELLRAKLLQKRRKIHNVFTLISNINKMSPFCKLEVMTQREFFSDNVRMARFIIGHQAAARVRRVQHC